MGYYVGIDLHSNEDKEQKSGDTYRIINKVINSIRSSLFFPRTL